MGATCEKPLRVNSKWSRVCSCSIGDRDGIAGRVREICEAGVVGRPGRCGDTLAQECTRCASSESDEPFWRTRRASLGEPDVRAVAGEAESPDNSRTI